MENNLNVTCSVCGIKYHVCKDCGNTKSFTPWRLITHDINCYKIFLSIRDFSNGYVTKQETKNILQTCDLTELETYQDNIKNVINTILKETKSKKMIPPEGIKNEISKDIRD